MPGPGSDDPSDQYATDPYEQYIEPDPYDYYEPEQMFRERAEAIYAAPLHKSAGLPSRWWLSDRHDDGHRNSRGDYYRTYTSAWWVWAFGLAGGWTASAFSSVNAHIDGPELEEVPVHSLRLSRKEPRSEPIEDSPTIEEIDTRRHTVLGAYEHFSVTSSRSLAHRCSPTPPVPRQTGSANALSRPRTRTSMRSVILRLRVYAQAVSDLEKSWQQALSYAKRKGASTFDETDQDATSRPRPARHRAGRERLPPNAAPPCTKLWHFWGP